jgi:Mg/Co/Ni transporter MgtE
MAHNSAFFWKEGSAGIISDVRDEEILLDIFAINKACQNLKIINEVKDEEHEEIINEVQEAERQAIINEVQEAERQAIINEVKEAERQAIINEVKEAESLAESSR